MCGKVVRKEKICRLSVLLRASMAVWENVHACDFTHSRKLYLLHYSTVCAAPAQNTSQLRQIGQLSRNLLAQTSMKMVMGTYLLYLR